MKRWISRIALPGAMACLLATGSLGCQNKLYEENLELHRQNRELQDQLTASQEKLKTAPDPGQLTSMQGEIAQRDAQIKQLQDQLRQQPANAPAVPGIAGIETSYDPASGKMTVNVPGDVLFSPGQADLKQSSLATLDKIVSALNKDYPGKKIFVEGHTDSDPISRTKNKWVDNLDLSAARARTVAQYLVAHGVSNGLVGMRAYGSTMPKDNKSRSRRVEIVVATRSGSGEQLSSGQ